MEQFIQPFIKIVENVFRVVCKTDVTSGRVFFVSKDEYESNWDISGIIGLSGQVIGAVAISLKDKTACQVTKILTGKDHDHIDTLVSDTIGEIINIIVGNVKKDFEEELRIKISLPTIIKGKAHSIVWPNEKTRIICIPFTIFSDHEMCLSVAVDPTK
ncbi:MAG: chemotaxis protein CheX [Treponema sp.]|nr:chemotaxis protein CheX [Treponema sp.]